MIAIDLARSAVRIDYEDPSHHLGLWPVFKEIEGFGPDCLPATGG